MAKAYAHLCETFVACAGLQRIWDKVAYRAANRAAERTTAGRIVDLKQVNFRMGKCGVIDTAQTVPNLENVNGGDIYFHPGLRSITPPPPATRSSNITSWHWAR